MRESANYRAALARLDEAFPDRELLTMRDVSRFLGRSYRWVAAHVPRSPLGISKVQLAKML